MSKKILIELWAIFRGRGVQNGIFRTSKWTFGLSGFRGSERAIVTVDLKVLVLLPSTFAAALVVAGLLRTVVNALLAAAGLSDAA